MHQRRLKATSTVNPTLDSIVRQTFQALTPLASTQTFTMTVKPSKTSTITRTVTSEPPNPTMTPSAWDTPTTFFTTAPSGTLAVTSFPTSITEITDDKGVQMLLVPAGEFTMGYEYGVSDDRPAHQVYLDSFYIDKHEITNALYKKCVSSGNCQLPKIPQNGANYYDNPNDLNYPVVYVDWYMANAFCKWRNVRLPTEAEWEKAAQPSPNALFTWRDYMVEVGSYEKMYGEIRYDETVYGAYDMRFNVTEWVSSLYFTYPYNANDGREDLSALGARTVRGTNFKWAYRYSNFDITSRYSYPPTTVAYYLGFRCAKDANP